MAIVLEESTKQDIKDWSHDLLVSSRCIGTFPTPADKLAAFINVRVSTKDLSKINPIYLEKNDSIIKKLLGQLRGLFYREKKNDFSR